MGVKIRFWRVNIFEGLGPQETQKIVQTKNFQTSRALFFLLEQILSTPHPTKKSGYSYSLSVPEGGQDPPILRGGGNAKFIKTRKKMYYPSTIQFYRISEILFKNALIHDFRNNLFCKTVLL